MLELDRERLLAVLADLAGRLSPSGRAGASPSGRRGADEPVEVVIVGGAAALLGGFLPAELTTVDCDVALHPRERWAELQRAAEAVARVHGLSGGWLNTECRRRSAT